MRYLANLRECRSLDFQRVHDLSRSCRCQIAVELDPKRRVLSQRTITAYAVVDNHRLRLYATEAVVAVIDEDLRNLKKAL